MNISDLSEAIGISKRTIENYLAEKRLPGPDFLTAMTEHLGVSASWLLTGTGVMDLSDHPNSVGGNNHTAPLAFVPIPHYAVEASAGFGSAVQVKDIGGTYAYKREWLERRALKPDMLSVISVRGDSMEPELYDGDRIVIDRSQTGLIDGSLYAVHFSDGLFVKRIQKLPGDRIMLISTNSRYSQITLDHMDLVNDLDGGSFKIIGRVIASMHEWH